MFVDIDNRHEKDSKRIKNHARKRLLPCVLYDELKVVYCIFVSSFLHFSRVIRVFDVCVFNMFKRNARCSLSTQAYCERLRDGIACDGGSSSLVRG